MYQGEDEDELTFDKGAIIYVVSYEDAEDEVDLYIRVCVCVCVCIVLLQ